MLEHLELLFERGRAAKLALVSGSCAGMLAHRAAPWTFVDKEGVEPTNNHAAFVLWRKRSFGTQSERGNLFAERLMTVAHTARKHGNSIEFTERGEVCLRTPLALPLKLRGSPA